MVKPKLEILLPKIFRFVSLGLKLGLSFLRIREIALKYVGYYRVVTRRHIKDKEIDAPLIMYRVEIASADFVGLAMTNALRTGVRFVVNSLEPLHCYVRIYLRGRKILMPEKLLHAS